MNDLSKMAAFRSLLFIFSITMATLPPEVAAVFPFDELEELALLILYGPSAPAPKILSVNPKINMTTGDLIQYYGYPFENHVITTSDGYILELHRIPGKQSNMGKGHPIIMAPGLLTDSGSYLYNGRNSPALLFHDAGHDVWLHNNRGTRYTRKHQTLSPDTDKEFWNFSFHEMGVYDLPAAVDHVLKVTGSKKVFLLGFSMGGTAMSIFLAEKPEYHNKVLGTFLWAPALNLRRIRFIPAMKYFQWISKIALIPLGNMEALPYTENFMLLASHICSGKLFSKLCAMNIYLFTSSYNLLMADYEKGEGTLAFYISRVSGTNVKTLYHFMQMAYTGDFRQYDYGSKTNMELYGQKIPPEYNLEAIDVPVSIFQFEQDSVVKAMDTVESSRRFKRLITMNVIKETLSDHMDFVIATDAVQLVYAKVLNQMALMAHEDELLTSSSKTAITHFVYMVILLATMATVTPFFALFIWERTKLKFEL